MSYPAPLSRQAPYVALQRALSRRRFMAGAGVLLSLPLLEAMTPAFATKSSDAVAAGKPRRMFGICNNLGLVPEYFFPKGAGRDYEASLYLKHLQEHREDFTVFSGVSHPDVDGGHPADNCFLTAAPHPSSGGFRNTISLDQYMAERIGHQTRFSSMTLGVNVARGSRSLSWTASGVMIPTEEKPSAVFRRMFMGGTAKEMAETELRTEYFRRRGRAGERTEPFCRGSRSRSFRSILYQCAGVGATDANGQGMGAEATSHRTGADAYRYHVAQRIHG